MFFGASQLDNENTLLHQIDELEQKQFEKQISKQLLNNFSSNGSQMFIDSPLLKQTNKSQLPKKCGINTISNGTKVLTINKTGKISNDIEYIDHNKLIHITIIK